MYKNKICGVYLITNNLNGMSYVGQSKNCRYRWSSHKSPSANRPIDKAIKEFGPENFTIKIEKECLPEELDFYERETIKKYNTMWPNGYNRYGGGKSGFDECEETRIKKSKSQKNRPPISDETRKKMSISQKNRSPMSNETKRKISKSHKGQPSSQKNIPKPKLKWITPSGEEKEMDIQHAKLWHPDWILIEKD